MNSPRTTLDRNLALEVVRVTEAAALACARLMGRGDRNGADEAAVVAMRRSFDGLSIRGTVVIGEGERDEAPMLYIGEKVGAGGDGDPEVDIAVDPLEGTNLCALGLPNAIAVVGRRALTRGLHLDRRAFLISYDPHVDAGDAIVERILAAVGPVGAGISLEYYFSSVDNERFGCGTKLPHNVTGLLGVMNGHGGDLRTGLPWQMVEIHEPMRLLLVVEATPAALLAVAGRQPEVKELVVNEWVQLVSVDPDSGAMAVFTSAGFVPYAPASVVLPRVRRSVDHHGASRGHLPPALVDAALVDPDLVDPALVDPVAVRPAASQVAA